MACMYEVVCPSTHWLNCTGTTTLSSAASAGGASGGHTARDHPPLSMSTSQAGSVMPVAARFRTPS
eukprot:925641-Pelagomonas_calceolata.AAC.2